MSFQSTLAHSSRVTKSRRPSGASLLRRSTSSPSKPSPRRKPSQTTTPTQDEDDEPLSDTGLLTSLASNLNFRDVPQYIQYILSSMFDTIPERAGMNSTRIAEVLNSRLHLPPIVTIAHIDALSPSSTKMEREIDELAHAGILRRCTIPHRGVGASAVGDGIVLVSEWEIRVREHSSVDDDLKEKYIALMREHPTNPSLPNTAFTAAELSTLTASGYLTSTSSPDSRTSFFAAPGAGSLASLSSAGSRHASGSLAAVGGAQASQHIPGGGTGNKSQVPTAWYNFSLPGTGAHIKLLISAREHLISLLKKSKFKEAPLNLLSERWDGGVSVAGNDERGRAKRARGEFKEVLPGRTKKWKAFWGLRFEWVLEECVGAGLVECFETGSVGVGVRLV